MPILGSSSFPRRNIEDLHSPLPLEMSILSCSGRGLAGKLEEIEHYQTIQRCFILNNSSQKGLGENWLEDMVRMAPMMALDLKPTFSKLVGQTY